jgi:hypothetical protein
MLVSSSRKVLSDLKKDYKTSENKSLHSPQHSAAHSVSIVSEVSPPDGLVRDYFVKTLAKLREEYNEYLAEIETPENAAAEYIGSWSYMLFPHQIKVRFAATPFQELALLSEAIPHAQPWIALYPREELRYGINAIRNGRAPTLEHLQMLFQSGQITNLGYTFVAGMLNGDVDLSPANIVYNATTYCVASVDPGYAAGASRNLGVFSQRTVITTEDIELLPFCKIEYQISKPDERTVSASGIFYNLLDVCYRRECGPNQLFANPTDGILHYLNNKLRTEINRGLMYAILWLREFRQALDESAFQSEELAKLLKHYVKEPSREALVKRYDKMCENLKTAALGSKSFCDYMRSKESGIDAKDHVEHLKKITGPADDSIWQKMEAKGFNGEKAFFEAYGSLRQSAEEQVKLQSSAPQAATLTLTEEKKDYPHSRLLTRRFLPEGISQEKRDGTVTFIRTKVLRI